MDDLAVTDAVVIPAAELDWRFDTSGGPGGQRANKAATRVELSFDLAASRALDGAMKERVLRQLGSRAGGGVVRVEVDATRSQWRNRQLARRRLAELLRDAMRTRPVRRRTAPSAAARRRRLAAKRHRSDVKRLRRPPLPDDD